MRLYHVSYSNDPKSIRKSVLRDRPRYRSKQMAAADGWNPVGVELRDDPILLHEHCGCHVVRVDISCTEEELSPFEDLKVPGFTDHIDRLLEDAWRRTEVPLIGTTYRLWVVPAEWLKARAVKVELVTDDPEDLWEEVARGRRRRPSAPVQDATDKQLTALARTLHGRRFDGRRFDEDRRPGTIAIQESVAVAHFDRLVERLAGLDVPLKRCGWLLAEAARRVAVDSHRLGSYVRQMRAAKVKSEEAEAQDDDEVKTEAVRLREEGVPVAQLRRRLLARFGAKRVPSEKVLRTRWLHYVFVRKR